MSREEKFTLEIGKCAALIQNLARKAAVRAHREPADLVQEILLNAWKSYPGFRGDSKFSTWLYRIGLLTVFQDHRKKSATFLPLESVVEGRLPEHAPHNSYSDDLRRLLPDNTEFMVFNLYVHGYTYADISASLGISINHVGVKIHRVRRRLQKSYTIT